MPLRLEMAVLFTSEGPVQRRKDRFSGRKDRFSGERQLTAGAPGEIRTPDLLIRGPGPFAACGSRWHELTFSRGLLPHQTDLENVEVSSAADMGVHPWWQARPISARLVWIEW